MRKRYWNLKGSDLFLAMTPDERRNIKQIVRDWVEGNKSTKGSERNGLHYKEWFCKEK